MNLPDYIHYRKDITGEARENLVRNESIKRTEIGEGEIIIPKHAPFFIESMELTHPDGSPMYLGVDYKFVDIDPEWTWLSGKEVGIFIKLLKPEIKEAVAQYQTVGTCPIFNSLIASLTELGVDDKRPIWWDDIEGKPKLWEIRLHSHDLNVDIYAVELLVETLAQRYEMIYSKQESSFHETFFLQELANLRSYFKHVNADLTDFKYKHTSNVWNVHGVRGPNIEGLELVDNVKTANLKETIEGKRDNLRLAAAPTHRTIATLGVNEKACLDVTGLTQYHISHPVSPKRLFELSLPCANIKTYGAGFYINDVGIGQGLIMGYDGETEGLIRVVNRNPAGRQDRPFKNVWENTHANYQPDDITDKLNAVMRGSNSQLFVIGNYRKNVYWAKKPETKSPWVKLQLPAGVVWDLDFIKSAVLIPTDDGAVVLRMLSGDDYGTIECYRITSAGLTTVSVTATNINGVSSGNKNTFKLFDFRQDFEDNTDGGLIHFQPQAKLFIENPTLSAIYEQTARKLTVKLLIEEGWRLKSGDVTWVNISHTVSIDIGTDGKLFIIPDELTPPVVDVEAMVADNSFSQYPQLSDLPVHFAYDGYSLSQTQQNGFIMVSHDDDYTYPAITEFKNSYFTSDLTSPDEVRNFAVLRRNGDDFRTAKDGRLMVNRFEPLVNNIPYTGTSRLGSYSESTMLGGVTFFKSKDTRGQFHHFVKRVGSKMSVKNLLDGPVWMRGASKDVHMIPYIQPKQFKVSIIDMMDNNAFGDTWFSGVSKSNSPYQGALRVAIISYMVNGTGKVTVSTYYAIEDGFVETLAGTPITAKMDWSIIFTTNPGVLPYHTFLLHEVDNGVIKTTIKHFTMDETKLKRTAINGARAFICSGTTAVTIQDSFTIDNNNFRPEHVTEDRWIHDIEGYESGKVIYQKMEDGVRLVYTSAAFINYDEAEFPVPLSVMFNYNRNGTIVRAVPLPYDDNVSLFYIRNLGWHSTTGDEDLLLGGGCLPGLSLHNEDNNIINNIPIDSIPVSPVDPLSPVGWFVYVPVSFTVLHNGRSSIVPNQVIDLRKVMPDYKNKVVYVYLQTVSDQTQFVFLTEIINDPDIVLVGRLVTNEERIVEKEIY